MGNRRSVAPESAGGARKSGDKKRRGRVGEFARGVRGELKKVNWPDREQLRQSTAVVLIVVFVLGVYVAAWDLVFQSLSRFVFL